MCFTFAKGKVVKGGNFDPSWREEWRVKVIGEEGGQPHDQGDDASATIPAPHRGGRARGDRSVV